MVILVVAVARMGKHANSHSCRKPSRELAYGPIKPAGKNKHHLLKYLSKNYVKIPRMFKKRDPYTWLITLQSQESLGISYCFHGVFHPAKPGGFHQPKMLTSLLLLDATVVAVASEVSCSTWRSQGCDFGLKNPSREIKKKT